MRRGPIFSLAIIWLSIVCAAYLQIMPLPPWPDAYIRPHWLLLTSLYWCLAMPHRFNIASAWIVGLMLDVLWGTMLGLNGIAFALCSSIVVHQCQKIRSYSVWHQAIIFTVMVGVYQFITATLVSWLNDAAIDSHYYLASLISVLAWPWIFFTLRKTRRRFFLS